jgi:chorismate mutase / prephenate dehydratase
MKKSLYINWCDQTEQFQWEWKPTLPCRFLHQESLFEMDDKRVYYLGPQGTFTYQAARTLFPEKNEQDFISGESIPQLLSQPNYLVIPYENSTQGLVSLTLDHLNSHIIKKEILLPIKHCFLSNQPKPKLVYSHPEALKQCSDFIKSRGLSSIQCNSTSEAAIQAKKNGNACIASFICADLYGLDVVEQDIANLKNNTTRFFYLEPIDRTKAVVTLDKPIQNTQLKLSCLVKARLNSLNELFSIFNDPIAIYKIDSRPFQYKIDVWEIIYFIEFDGRFTNEVISKMVSLGINVEYHGTFETMKY